MEEARGLFLSDWDYDTTAMSDNPAVKSGTALVTCTGPG